MVGYYTCITNFELVPTSCRSLVILEMGTNWDPRSPKITLTPGWTFTMKMGLIQRCPRSLISLPGVPSRAKARRRLTASVIVLHFSTVQHLSVRIRPWNGKATEKKVLKYDLWTSPLNMQPPSRKCNWARVFWILNSKCSQYHRKGADSVEDNKKHGLKSEWAQSKKIASMI